SDWMNHLITGKRQQRGRIWPVAGVLAILAAACGWVPEGHIGDPAGLQVSTGGGALASDMHDRGKGGWRGIGLKRLNRVEGGTPGHYIVVLDESTPATRLMALNPFQSATRLAGRYSF